MSLVMNLLAGNVLRGRENCEEGRVALVDYDYMD